MNGNTERAQYPVRKGRGIKQTVKISEKGNSDIYVEKKKEIKEIIPSGPKGGVRPAL